MHSTEFDAVIIGSGAGGCAAAHNLVKAGLRVALVEKGHELPMSGVTLDVDAVVHQGRFKSHEQWRSRDGSVFAPEEWFNVGGKTKWYGAALLKYSPEEFDADTVRNYRGSPIGYAELKPYYDAALERLKAREFDCEPDLARLVRKLGRQPAGWREEPLSLGLSSAIQANPREASHFDGFASVAGLKADAENAFLAPIRGASNFKLFLGKPVQALLPDPSNRRRVAGVLLSSGERLMARAVVLAAGALHSPRLLQRFIDRQDLKEASTQFNAVGRYLKLHLLTALVGVSPSKKTDLLRKTRLFLHDRFPRSSVQPLGFDGELISTLMPEFLPTFLRQFVGARAYGFFLQTEDEAHADNRILDADVPLLDYDEARSPRALKEHLEMTASFKSALLGAGMLSFTRRVGIAGTAHASGTLVAGDDPADSVVNGSGKVHGLESLYVVDGSVLPRSSRVNPSLTIFAWSLRASSLLARELSAARPAMEVI